MTESTKSAMTDIDRYVSFKGIDCDGNADKLMEIIEHYAAKPSSYKAFWAYFLQKRTAKSGPDPDSLFLIHAHINSIREAFEEYEDTQALELLFWIEENCC